MRINRRLKEIQGKISEILIKYLDPTKIILFGSRAKGNAGKHADLDIAVTAKRPAIAMERKINEKIEEISGLYEIDIIYLSSIDKDFREIVLKTGKVIYERGN